MTTDHNLVISLFMTFHQVINSIGGVIVHVGICFHGWLTVEITNVGIFVHG
jgi:hypothetical protein